jgi:Domain of unknown function (DUF4384)
MKAMCMAVLLAAAQVSGLVSAPAPKAQLAKPAAAVPDKAPGLPSGLKISLERRLPDGKVQAVASDHVFEPGDVVHFRVTSDFDGFLYVMDQGTSGHYATVFPSSDAGADNRVRQGQMFSIPTGETSWFEISGPAGFDIVYFLLSPAALATPTAASFAQPAPPSSLMPRCNDAVFKARGECTDINAGPAPLPKTAPLPPPIEPMAPFASRDIKVVKKQDGVTVASTGNTTTPLIYTFKLAHH